MTDYAALAAPFPPDRVSWRVGSTTQDKTKGMALAYIDARDVMERLDAVVGSAGWSDRFEIHGGTTICYITIDGVTKADGAGATDVEAEKGSLSDAFKRAAVKWGIGRYLYDVDSPWVEIVARGKPYSIADSARPKLLAALGGRASSAKSTQPTHPQGPALTPAQSNTYGELVSFLKSAKTPEELKKKVTQPDYKQGCADLTPAQLTDLRNYYSDRMNALQTQMLGAG